MVRRLFLVLVMLAAACSAAAEPPPREETRPDPPITATTVSTTAAVPSTSSVPTSAPPTSQAPPTSAPTTSQAPTTSSSTTAAVVDEDPILLAWVSGFLPANFGQMVAAVEGVEAVTVVAAGISDLVGSRDGAGALVDAATSGFAFPLETFAVDPSTYSSFLPESEAAIVSGLAADEVVLGETSARIRRLGPGGVLEFAGGVTATVAAVFADPLIGGAEVVTVAPELIAPGRLTPRYALVRGDIEADRLRSALRTVLGAGAPVQVKTEGDTPLLRHADVVRSQAAIKERFGEFAYRDGAGRRIEIDPAWVEANIVERELPLLGRFACHRDFTALLEDIMVDLESAGLESVIDRSAFFGCWNPRWISDRRGLSRHAWGAAVDINLGNATDGGNGSPVNAALLRLTEAAGMTSGHLWVQADPGHFEWFED